MLHCCNWQHNPASPNAPAFQFNILLGIAQPSLSITRFRLHSKICVSVKCLRPAAGAVQQSAVEVKVKGQGEGQTLAICFAQAVQCAVEAFASGCTESKGLLTAQAQPLSEESLCRQQAFATSCANSCCSLPGAVLRKLDTRQDSQSVLSQALTFKGYRYL